MADGDERTDRAHAGEPAGAEIPPPEPPTVPPEPGPPPQPPGPAPSPATAPPAAYPPPGYVAYGPPPQPTSTNGMAIASLVLGILWLYWIGSILALIFGYVAKRQIDESAGRQTGRGMAVAGIVLGWIGVGALVLTIVVILAVVASG